MSNQEPHENPPCTCNTERSCSGCYGGTACLCGLTHRTLPPPIPPATVESIAREVEARGWTWTLDYDPKRTDDHGAPAPAHLAIVRVHRLGGGRWIYSSADPTDPAAALRKAMERAEKAAAPTPPRLDLRVAEECPDCGWQLRVNELHSCSGFGGT